MEYADGGDLLQRINSLAKRKSRLSESDCWSYFIQILRGLQVLHDLKIVHRDIKCANVFLTKDGTIKLGDLNVSKVAKRGLLSTQTGTPYYASPEVWCDKPYDLKSDIWSIGCVLFEMAALEPPFKARDMKGLFKSVTSGRIPSLPPSYSNDLNYMVRLMLQQAPALRPTCNQLLSRHHLQKNMPAKLLTDIGSESPGLIGTIKVPMNLGQITDRLPKAQYEEPKSKMTRSPSLPAHLNFR